MSRLTIPLALSLLLMTYVPHAFAETASHLSIQGHVQHVHYRLWARQNAIELGLRGWVRNLRDGSVEAVLIGSDKAIAAMITASRQGPQSASVTTISQRPATQVERDKALGSFLILKTER
jgi:acylphosphatase